MFHFLCNKWETCARPKARLYDCSVLLAKLSSTSVMAALMTNNKQDYTRDFRCISQRLKCLVSFHLQRQIKCKNQCPFFFFYIFHVIPTFSSYGGYKISNLHCRWRWNFNLNINYQQPCKSASSPSASSVVSLTLDHTCHRGMVKL